MSSGDGRSTWCIILLDGDLLECLDGIDPSFDIWLRDQRQALRDRARSVAEASLHEQTEPDTTIFAAKRLLQIDRAHEGAWRALMAAFAEKGEHGMAVHAYDQCRAILASLFDAVPSDETQQLLIAIRGPQPFRPRSISGLPKEPGFCAQTFEIPESR